jgi:hypothetical protein
MSVICFDLQFSRSTRPMTSFCIFIAYINTEGILFNVKITRWHLNDQSSYFQSILKYNLLDLHSRNGNELWWRLCQQTGKINNGHYLAWWQESKFVGFGQNYRIHWVWWHIRIRGRWWGRRKAIIRLVYIYIYNIKIAVFIHNHIPFFSWSF